MLMRALFCTFFLPIFTLPSTWAEEVALQPPLPERMAELLAFSGPVTLERKVSSPEELAQLNRKQGKALAFFVFSNPAQTADRIKVTVLEAGAFMGDKRGAMEARWRANPREAMEGLPALGVFPTADGREIFQFLGGMGPGGSAYGALLRCRDARYELVLIQETAADGDWKGTPPPTPKQELKAIIEAVEKLVVPAAPAAGK